MGFFKSFDFKNRLSISEFSGYHCKVYLELSSPTVHISPDPVKTKKGKSLKHLGWASELSSDCTQCTPEFSADHTSRFRYVNIHISELDKLRKVLRVPL